ncbi:hypothetical protein CAAU_1514 [Caloramator australicus RC3]|uniref:Uncharacterized protein n=1 Tax=Caloramator australicus RC3 TaxID=857293 RepID=I7KUJ4_9CLOT|nr:hypothetical protein CAAU_1514 [Caloramator australicus RC3]
MGWANYSDARPCKFPRSFYVIEIKLSKSFKNGHDKKANQNILWVNYILAKLASE